MKIWQLNKEKTMQSKKVKETHIVIFMNQNMPVIICEDGTIFFGTFDLGDGGVMVNFAFKTKHELQKDACKAAGSKKWKWLREKVGAVERIGSENNWF